jgi:hypothetical protein
VNRRYGGTCRFHLQGALLATCFRAGFLLGILFDPEEGGDMFLRIVGFSACRLPSRWFLTRRIRPWRWRRTLPPKRRLTFHGLHGGGTMLQAGSISFQFRYVLIAVLKMEAAGCFECLEMKHTESRSRSVLYTVNTRLKLVPRSRMRESIPPLPHTSLWRA